ncbi:hypothetical protein AKJ37_05390 [candidate division MSBL1 archaeon SCGC-AAA259I09]|uniref:PRC-barrel domain-containing protein n=1 Tax=candidate division MSBL1 archaeon SCGC-AAA259I09 TaxID=1698267 RepID=A0A133UQG4_9EURY|nr:hypothetical protein AKJ37_05390 [candidate division MSBL1 archaeon SCGC-AAA259I09]
MKISDYYGLDMYSDKGYYVGEVQEVMLDPDEGKLAGLTIGTTDEGGHRTVPYEWVSAVGEIIVVSAEPGEEEPEVRGGSGP